jgi:hypothetical protein
MYPYSISISREVISKAVLLAVRYYEYNVVLKTSEDDSKLPELFYSLQVIVSSRLFTDNVR